MLLSERYRAVGWIGLLTVLWFALAGVIPAGGSDVSGHLVEGLRYLPVPPGEHNLNYRVFRGDYIKFDLSPDSAPVLLKIPELGIESLLSADITSAPYFKMKQSGRFAFTLGSQHGELEVVAYHPANYREMTAAEAAALVAREDPLVLDVRTPAEFKSGHLPDAVLIPVQEVQRRIGELTPYRNRDILVYCATGNRSTVASKILIDQGFAHIANLRHGIVDWHQRKYPVIR